MIDAPISDINQDFKRVAAALGCQAPAKEAATTAPSRNVCRFCPVPKRHYPERTDP